MDYPSLSVCRSALGKQATTFYHAMKFLTKRHGIEFQFSRSKSLAVYGCHEIVRSRSLVPRCLRQAGQSPVHAIFCLEIRECHENFLAQIRTLWSVQ